MSRNELLAAIAGSEGRTIACETIDAIMPMLGDITNAEFAAAMGADILLLNMFDVQKPHIQGLPKTEPDLVIRKLKELTGRPIGINLEPVEQVLSSEDPDENMWAMTSGRKATMENAEKAVALGVDFILLTGNPGIVVTNEAIEQTLKRYKQTFGDKIILAAGKMHASGILTEGAEKIITKEDISAFAVAGADIILLPAPGTVPGIWYGSQDEDYGRSQHYNGSRYHMLNLHATFTKGTVEFRLFQFDAPAGGKQNGLHAGQLKSYIQLCLALSQMAKEVRTASPKPQQNENPKYAMRTWLLRLGFIGEEFATAREVLTKRLAGDASFRHGRA